MAFVYNRYILRAYIHSKVTERLGAGATSTCTRCNCWSCQKDKKHFTVFIVLAHLFYRSDLRR